MTCPLSADLVTLSGATFVTRVRVFKFRQKRKRVVGICRSRMNDFSVLGNSGKD
jgi:hypothetical protein